MPTPCPICDDSGLRIIERPDGTRAAQECSCRAERRRQRQVASACIPELFSNRTFENYKTSFSGASRSLSVALTQAQGFVNGYPLDTRGKGLLFVGRPGLGKTHLAIATLRALIDKNEVNGLFVDYRDLLKQVQNSYNSTVTATELQVLKPIFEAEVLVIDDIGASKPSDWVFDTVAHILNSRYNRELSTILTTNYPNKPEKPYEELVNMSVESRTLRPRTLGDQIGDRVLSRLQEMCIVVEMEGKDYRSKARRADMLSAVSDELSFDPPPDVSFQSKVTVAAPGKLVFKRINSKRNLQIEPEEEIVGRKRMGKYASANPIS